MSVPSSFLSSTSAICEVGGRGSSRCGGVPNEGRRGVSRDRGTRWLEVALDLRGRRQRSDKLLYRSPAVAPPFGEVCADSRTCRFHMQFRSRNCCRVQIAPTARAGTHLFPLATGIHSHKLPASISNCIFTNARPWGSRGSSSPSRLIIAAYLGLTIDCIDSNENLCQHAKNAHHSPVCSLQRYRATTALMEQVQRQH